MLFRFLSRRSPWQVIALFSLVTLSLALGFVALFNVVPVLACALLFVWMVLTYRVGTRMVQEELIHIYGYRSKSKDGS